MEAWVGTLSHPPLGLPSICAGGCDNQWMVLGVREMSGKASLPSDSGTRPPGPAMLPWLAGKASLGWFGWVYKQLTLRRCDIGAFLG